MTSAELIEEINKLSHEEQLKVLAFLREKLIANKSELVRHLVDEGFKRVADKVFTENDELFRKLAQ